MLVSTSETNAVSELEVNVLNLLQASPKSEGWRERQIYSKAKENMDGGMSWNALIVELCMLVP